MINFTNNVTHAQIHADHVFVMLKKETIDHLNAYLTSQGKTVTITTYDDIIQEWVNWQKKADEEVSPG
jgi:hypothetical protein